MKTQHQNLEFGHTGGEIKEKLAKKKVHQHSTGAAETQKNHQFWW
jgi:di/tripeptidase